MKKALAYRQTATYRAVLKGGHLEWQGEVPPEIQGDRALPVDVTILRDENLSAADAYPAETERADRQ